jgi:hypothetical protein
MYTLRKTSSIYGIKDSINGRVVGMMWLEPPESSGERAFLMWFRFVLLSRARRPKGMTLKLSLLQHCRDETWADFPLGGRIGALSTRAGTNTIRRERLHSSMAWRTREPSVATYCVPRDTTEDMR